MIRETLRRGSTLALILACTGCMVGPDYKQPAALMTANYKELGNWQPAQPSDTTDRGPWWTIYHDPVLDQLEQQVNISNQNVKTFEAQYRNAVALVGEAQANLFPTLTLNPGVTRNASGSGGSHGATVFNSSSGGTFIGGGGGPHTQYSLEGNANWDLDVWGAIRRQINSEVAGAQVSAADLANAELSAQATLATDYFDLRAEDALADLLRQTVAADQRALEITQNQYRAGTVSNADVVTAQAQLETVRATLVGVGVQRSQFEHAIAVLVGRPPADLTIAVAPLAKDVPFAPPGVPSTLLERRPDIAAAERSMQQQSELIGVAVAAYYPTISLSALGGFAGSPLSELFRTTAAVWAIGATASETVFSGGARPASVSAARANYDAAVATYRQTVLTAFQQVEDQLAALRILEQQAAAEALAVQSAQRALDVTLNEYRAGTVAYTSVITQQTTLLGDQQTALSIQQSRLAASTALIEALGGGWTNTELPGSKSLRLANPMYP